MYQQMSRSGDQSEARPPAFTQLPTHWRRDERLSQPCPARELNPDLWCGSAIRHHSTTGPYIVRQHH
ncbi:hypothetical protein TNCV_5093951 [Trichonephila clavipes]|nr:hypothetical protein TNCV_5093951 [Trichonephila clavipes]